MVISQLAVQHLQYQYHIMCVYISMAADSKITGDSSNVSLDVSGVCVSLVYYVTFVTQPALQNHSHTFVQNVLSEPRILTSRILV